PAERRQLTRERRPAGIIEIQERLLAESIARQQQLALRAIGNRKRKHAEQLRQQLGAPLPIAIDQDFGVRLGLERMAERGELLAQLDVVVNLAVVGDD